MLKVPAEFPQAGSEALYKPPHVPEEVRVRIVTLLEGHRALIAGKCRWGGINCIVLVSQLRPYIEPRAAIELWADRRIASVLPSTFTSAADAFTDFKRWHFQLYAKDTLLGFQPFKRDLTAMGYAKDNRGNRLGWTFALSAERLAA